MKNQFQLYVAILVITTLFVFPRTASAASPSPLNLRVNYGHDWVESFYEAGHVVRVFVTESDGVTVKASARLLTEPQDFWDGATGFQTRSEDWHPAAPDIQPYDWVYARVDNGASARVQIGDISGAIDLAADSIQGAIAAPWFSDAVNVECHPWGAPEPTEMKFDTIQPDGVDPYSCSWAGEWDIQPYQDVGVGYYGADGHWVANAFFMRNPRIIASVAGDWFWTTEFNPGTLNLFIYVSAEEGAELLWQGSREADEAGFAFVGYEDHGQDLVPGNYLVVSDGATEKGLVLETITMEVFDTANEIMAGSAPGGREVVVVAGMAEAETQGVIFVIADPETGAWMADFTTIGFDITEEMRPWSFAQISDEDGDANEAGTPPPPNKRIYAQLTDDSIRFEYSAAGALVTFSIYDAPGGTLLWAGSRSADDAGFASVGLWDHGVDLKPGMFVVVSDGITTKDLLLERLSLDVFDPDRNILAGRAAAGRSVWAVVGNETVLCEGEVTANANGMWIADFDDLGCDVTADMSSYAQVFDGEDDTTEAVLDFIFPY